MSLAVLIPYRPDSIHRERIHSCTTRMWATNPAPVEVLYCDDGLDGELFSYAKAANWGRANSDADVLVTYSVDALPLPAKALQELETLLMAGTPWAAIFEGQRRFTADQTERLLGGYEVGEPAGEICPGREALLAVRADVWDAVRGYDERFVGWGPEDLAFHRVLKTLYPDGQDVPQHGLFASLWHPPVTRAAFPALQELWHSYPAEGDVDAMREFYLNRA